MAYKRNYAKKTYPKKEPVTRIPFIFKNDMSEEQSDIRQAYLEDLSNIYIPATAGSGKSTIIKLLLSLKPLELSAYFAFNVSIAEEMEPHCPPTCAVKNAHKFGYAALTRAFGRLTVEKHKTARIIKELYPNYDPDLVEPEKKGLVISRLMNLINLVSKMKVNLKCFNEADEIREIIEKYNIDFEEIVNIMPAIYMKIISVPNVIDLDDMIWFAVIMKVPMDKFPILMIDECQDLSPMLLEFAALLASGRVVYVGDPYQSIYGFSGAATDSMDRLWSRFGGKQLPLNTSYRCGQKIVEHANRICPTMRAFHKNPEGEVLMPDKLDLEVPNGSMILSRRNANLIKPCFDLLLAGRRATIKGKEIGEGLVRFIRDLKADTVRELRVNVEKHRAKKMESFSDSTKASSMELMNDTCDCVLRFAEDAVTVEDVVLRIENIFSDTDDKNAITLSSAHKSKGLEADCVTIIDAPRIRMSSDRMTDDEHKQESNLEFVAITRAKSKLILVQS